MGNCKARFAEPRVVATQEDRNTFESLAEHMKQVLVKHNLAKELDGRLHGIQEREFQRLRVPVVDKGT